jgi:polyisoprenyl-phosphate glycosyltransferase
VNYEIIFVDDRCPANSWEVVEELAHKNERVKAIRLSRNFGQHAAIYAGLSFAQGEWIVVMDCDLQDRPEEIATLYAKAQEGFDVVLARREERQDSLFKRWGSQAFYKVLSFLTDTKQDAGVGNFGIYHRKTINALMNMGDYIRYFPTMIRWVGFNQTIVSVRHDARYEGTSAYSLLRLINLSFDVIISFSDKPLRLITRAGLCISALSLFCALYVVLLWMSGEILVLGWTSLMVSIWFLGGLIISIIGVVSLYLGKTFDQVKQRPRFIVKETRNLSTDKESFSEEQCVGL